MAAFLRKIAWDAHCKKSVAKIDLQSAADTLKCKRQTLEKLTRHLRRRPWFFQGYHTVVFLTHEKDPVECPRGKWMIWAANRHSIHRIWAAPGKWRQLRWHLRQGRATHWHGYLSLVKKWALAMIFRKIRGRDSKHKGFSQPRSSARARGARAPAENRPAWRRFGGIASKIEAFYASIPDAPRAKIMGWLIHRLDEQHSFASIQESLTHAVNLWRKRRQTPFQNPVSWVCHVAGYRLASDGLVPSQRRGDWQTGRHGADAPAFNEVLQSPKKSDYIDPDGQAWTHKGGTHWEKTG